MTELPVRMLQCVAVCCSVLQCVAVCCNMLQCTISDRIAGAHVRHTTDLEPSNCSAAKTKKNLFGGDVKEKVVSYMNE